MGEVGARRPIGRETVSALEPGMQEGGAELRRHHHQQGLAVGGHDERFPLEHREGLVAGEIEHIVRMLGEQDVEAGWRHCRSDLGEALVVLLGWERVLERELTESALVEWTALQARVHGYRHRQGPSKASPTKGRAGSDRLLGVARSDSAVVYVSSVVGRRIFPPRFLD